MKLTIGLLIGSTIVLSSCLGLVAQDVDFDAPIAAPVVIQPMQVFTANGGVQYFAQSRPLGGVTSMGWAGGPFNSLHDPSVMKDLELVDEQKSKIADLRSDYNKRRTEMWKERSKVANKNDKEGLKKIQKKLSDLQVEQNDAFSEVLLPHQLDRIKQVARQIQLQRLGGASVAFQYGQLAKELDITAEQKKKLAEIQKKMNEDIAAKSKEIRAAAKKQAMEQLTAEQKTKFEELTGEEFKRNPQDWQEHRQRTLTRQKNARGR
jgi:Spy/CpxP family protein refolding chaperone